MKIVFMGTPVFASVALERLYSDGYDICGVFTQPDKPVNRGMKLTPTPVKTLAQLHQTPVFQPQNLRDGAALEILEKLAPDLIVVVAYGKLLPREILEVPGLGCVNIHASLLPKYRGAAPVQWAVLNGEKVTGVTSMYMAQELDSGDIIANMFTNIGEDETSGELFERLGNMGAELLSRTVAAIENGTAQRIPQNESEATYAPMLSREMAPIDWSKPPAAIKNHVRGMQPWPGAIAIWNGKKFKIFKLREVSQKTDRPDGSIVEADKNGLFVACGGGSVVEVVELQAEGKRRMKATDYLMGNSI